MDSGSILGIISIVISVATTVIGIINHKKIRSKCCGREVSASFDIEPSTPLSDKNRNPDLKIVTEKKSEPPV
jgi:hypothetical protein